MLAKATQVSEPKVISLNGYPGREFELLLNDRHSKAYKTLLNEESRTIARKLGLKNAHTADICLDCHADNVPKDKRGPEFFISDGVGCETCHGGGENYIIGREGIQRLYGPAAPHACV